MSQDQFPRLLLVEDNPPDAEYIREMLREAMDRSLDRGRELAGERLTDGGTPMLTHVTELEPGLRLLEERSFDALLLDLNLPDSSGLETLSTVYERTETVPVVVLTGLLDREVAMEALRIGAEEYLVKDEITPELLVRTIYHAIERTAREREQKRYETLIEESTDVSVIVDPDGTLRYLTPSVENVLGYRSEELVGEDVLEYVHPEDRDAVRSQFRRLSEDAGHRSTVECRFEHADGSWVSLHARGRNLLDDPIVGGIVVYTRDITERKRHERRLEALNRTNHELTLAETPREIADTALDAVGRILGYEIGCVRLYDPDENSFEVVAMTEEARSFVDSRPAFEMERTQAGRVFRRQEPAVSESSEGDGHGCLHLPLGQAGVVTVVVPAGVESAELQVAEALAASVRTALERADREQRLRAGEAELRRQHDDLETLHRINLLVREIGDHLVNATTREELQQAICDRLVSSELYRSAWIGQVQYPGEELSVRTGAGIEEAYLEGLDAMPVSELADGAVAAVLATREVQVVRQYAVDTPDGEPADDTNVEATAAVPLGIGDRINGVLVVNGVREEVFSEEALAGFESLGRLAGFAVDALRTREVVLSDTTVEVELAVEDPGFFYHRLTRELDCRCRLERSIPIDGGRVVHYHTVEGAESEAVVELAASEGSIEEADVLSERGEGFVLQTITDGSPVEGVLAAGARIREAVAEEGAGRIVIEAPQSVEIREVVGAFERGFADVDVVAKRRRDRSVRTADDVWEEVPGELTEKQRSAVEAAYAAGYWDWPREVTAEELAGSLGISSSTLHQHLRKGIQGVLGAVLDDPGEGHE